VAGVRLAGCVGLGRASGRLWGACEVAGVRLAGCVGLGRAPGRLWRSLEVSAGGAAPRRNRAAGGCGAPMRWLVFGWRATWGWAVRQGGYGAPIRSPGYGRAGRARNAGPRRRRNCSRDHGPPSRRCRRPKLERARTPRAGAERPRVRPAGQRETAQMRRAAESRRPVLGRVGMRGAAWWGCASPGVEARWGCVARPGGDVRRPVLRRGGDAWRGLVGMRVARC
jgi:hypothetical protein